MKLLVVDKDEYSSSLVRHAKRQGHSAEMRSPAEAIGLTAAGARWDAVVIDAAPRTEHGTIGEEQMQHSMALCQRLSSDPATEVTVYSHITRAEWHKMARRFEIGMGRLQFYWKGSLEIPPLVKGIEGIIRGTPAIVGFEIDTLVPLRVTREWLQASQEQPLYAILCEYVTRKVHSAIMSNTPMRLSAGNAMLWRIIILESEIGNGGFEQYCANRDHADPPGEAVVTIETLRRMGAGELADLTNEAYATFGRLAVTEPNTTEEQALLDALDTFTDRYYDLEDRHVLAIENYIIAQPDEFCDAEEPNRSTFSL